MGRKTPDLTGQRFGRLQALSRDWDAPGPHAKWLCWCDCGTMTSAGSGALRSGMTQSCGCLHRERVSSTNTAHTVQPMPETQKTPVPHTAQVNGAIPVHRVTRSRDSTADPAMWRSSSPSYGSWINMIYRCTNPGTPRYPGWGGRGITVCERWLESFDNFLADMGERPPGMTLDRIDNDGPYYKNNCRWATPHEQLVNSRNFKLVPDVVCEIERLRATGMTLKAIGTQVGLNHKTVSRALTGKSRSRKRADG